MESVRPILKMSKKTQIPSLIYFITNFRCVGRDKVHQLMVATPGPCLNTSFTSSMITPSHIEAEITPMKSNLTPKLLLTISDFTLNCTTTYRFSGDRADYYTIKS